MMGCLRAGARSSLGGGDSSLVPPRDPAAAAGARAGAPPATARRGGAGRPRICGAPGASSRGAVAAVRSVMAIGDAAPYGGTFFFFRSEMDPLNTLWLAPVGSAMVDAQLFRYQAGRAAAS